MLKVPWIAAWLPSYCVDSVIWESFDETIFHPKRCSACCVNKTNCCKQPQIVLIAKNIWRVKQKDKFVFFTTSYWNPTTLSQSVRESSTVYNSRFCFPMSRFFCFAKINKPFTLGSRTRLWGLDNSGGRVVSPRQVGQPGISVPHINALACLSGTALGVASVTKNLDLTKNSY